MYGSFDLRTPTPNLFILCYAVKCRTILLKHRQKPPSPYHNNGKITER